MDAFLHELTELNMLAWDACSWMCFSRSCLDRVICTFIACHLVCSIAIDLAIELVVSIASSELRTSSVPWSGMLSAVLVIRCMIEEIGDKVPRSLYLAYLLRTRAMSCGTGDLCTQAGGSSDW